MLEVAGLSAAEEALYLAVLGLPPVTVEDAGQACDGLDRAGLAAALETLARKGLLTRLPDSPRRYAPVAPQTALRAALLAREQELLRLERELGQARDAIACLAERYRSVPRHAVAGEPVETVAGTGPARQRWQGAVRGAACQVRMLNRPPFEGESRQPCRAELGALGRGVAVRAVYDQSAVGSPASVARRRAEIAAGAQLRVTGSLPVPLLLADDQPALLPGPGGLLVVHGGVLLDAVSELFELAWANALPLDLGPAAGPADAPHGGTAGTAAAGPGFPAGNATMQTIFGLLAAGLTDQAIARRLGCSERTIQRHIQKMTQAVGVKTRFQAALAIGRRNPDGMNNSR